MEQLNCGIEFQISKEKGSQMPVLKNIDGKSGCPYLYYPLLEETGIVKHCFTTRLGGVSKGIFESLNLSFSRGDDPEAVKENFRDRKSVV